MSGMVGEGAAAQTRHHPVIMISGDNQRVANAIAEQVGLDEAWGDLMPEDKVEAITKLQAQAKVAMVGDGVNDAPTMDNIDRRSVLQRCTILSRNKQRNQGRKPKIAINRSS